MLPASTGHVRCSSCGSPTSIAATEARQTTVIIETAARVLAERPINGEKGSNSPSVPSDAGPTCRKCQEEFSAEQDTPHKPDADRCRPSRLPAGCDAWCSRRFYSYFRIYCCASCSRRASGARPGRRSAQSDAPSTGTSGPAIPRIIHQMYATSELPAKWKDVPERGRRRIRSTSTCCGRTTRCAA